MSTKTPATLVLEDFEPYKGAAFTLVAADAELPVTLAEVTAIHDHGHNPDRPPFSLTLHAPRKPEFPQGLFHLRHPDFDDPLLFTAPLGPDPENPDVMRYQVMFT